jgi:subtilisin family serine protease
MRATPTTTAPANALHALIGLAPLMAASQGLPSVTVAVIDGPIDRGHPALAEARIDLLSAAPCDAPGGAACRHGTFIAGLLAAARSDQTAGICPGCRLLVRPVFGGKESDIAAHGAQPEELAAAILQAIAAGARIINLSLALFESGGSGASAVQAALDAAMRRGVLVAAASGNQGVVGSTPITRHPWVIPVVACDPNGWPLALANLAASVGRNGLLAPGENIVGLRAGGGFETARGTSVAVPFVSGALALLASLCPWATAAELRHAVASRGIRRRSIVPPLLDAAGAWRILAQGRGS